MNCRYCGADNRDSAKFCENCGGALETTTVDNNVNTMPQEPANDVANTMPPAPQSYQPYQQSTMNAQGYQPYQQPTMNAQGYQPYNPNAQQPYNYNVAPPEATPPANGLAVASLVCGILTLFCCGLFTGIPAIICGILAKSRGNKSGMATAGIICGGIGLALWVIGFILGMTGSLLSADMMYW